VEGLLEACKYLCRDFKCWVEDLLFSAVPFELTLKASSVVTELKVQCILIVSAYSRHRS
jgi:hypothetical protein